MLRSFKACELQAMNHIIEFLKQTEGTVFVNEDGLKDSFKLRPPLSGQELFTLEAGLPCPLPQEIRELLNFARGFDGVLDGIDFVNATGFGFGVEDVFPRARTLAADGYGNYWVLDLTRESRNFGPIFYACHDPAAIVYQTDSLLHFIQEVVRFCNSPWKSEIDDVHEHFAGRIWRENPCVLTFAQAVTTGAPELK